MVHIHTYIHLFHFTKLFKASNPRQGDIIVLANGRESARDRETSMVKGMGHIHTHIYTPFLVRLPFPLGYGWRFHIAQLFIVQLPKF